MGGGGGGEADEADELIKVPRDRIYQTLLFLLHRPVEKAKKQYDFATLVKPIFYNTASTAVRLL